VASAITAREYDGMLLQLKQQFTQIRYKWGFACSAGSEVTDTDHWEPRTIS
jgi:hypothetical protein